jgi:hypothetical protein
MPETGCLPCPEAIPQVPIGVRTERRTERLPPALTKPPRSTALRGYQGILVT